MTEAKRWGGHNKIQMEGRRFGSLSVVSECPERVGGRRVQYVCRCDCGTARIVLGESLRLGRTVSCGCIGRANRLASHLIHGQSKRGRVTNERQIYGSMKDRCLNPNNQNYRHYGGRGIDIAPEWRDSFEAFFRDMGRRPSADHSLERLDNDGPYSKSNCVWATRKQQARNRRVNRAVIRGDGKRYGTVIEAAEDVGVTQSCIGAACRGLQRTCAGWTWQFEDLALLRSKPNGGDNG